MPSLPDYSFTTINAPSGTSQHNQDDLLCLPSHWTTVLRFFILNYVAHAFTIWARPGETTSEKVFAIVLAFFFPVSGLGRGVDAIYRHASYQRHGGFWKGIFGIGTNEYEIHKAARAGALAVVVRENIGAGIERADASSSCFALNALGWEGVTLRGNLKNSESSNAINTSNAVYITVRGDHEAPKPRSLHWTRNVSGVASKKEPSGYRILELPGRLAKAIKLPSEEDAHLHISQTSNLPVTVIAVFQIVYATYQLSRVTGDQFDRFGYSAFHLTVIPYLVMSFINLLGNLATPIYPSIYLVKTTTLTEAKRRGNSFDGWIGEIEDSRLYKEELTTDIQNEEEEFEIIPYSCRERRPRNENTMDRDGMALDVCFNPRCSLSHRGYLEVQSGMSEIPDTTFGETLFKIGALALAIIAPVAPIIVVGRVYPQPERMDQRIILPLWIATGDVIGIFLLYHRTCLSILPQLRIWLLQRLCCRAMLTKKERNAPISSKPVVWLLSVILGLIVGVWNFYIVAAQILAFGDCINMSD